MDRALFEAAKAVRLRAHDRYSGFKVGVAIRTAAGSVHTGCNVENASLPEGWCAETSAIGAMVSSSGPGDARRIVAVAVVADAIGGRPTTPCGGCRQRLAEFGSPDAPVDCYDPEGRGATFSLADLLPQSFALKDSP